MFSMSSGKRTKDRHVSGTGRSDSDKRGGGGSFAWGKAGEDASSLGVAKAGEELGRVRLTLVAR